MPPQEKYAVPPPDVKGFRVFVKTAYPPRYNFAVENYNAVSVNHKTTMRGGRLLLFRSVVAVVWIVAIVFAFLTFVSAALVTFNVLLSALYIGLSLYNGYVYFNNRDLLNASRLLPAKTAGPNGLDYEWVFVPLDSRSANERLSAVDQAAIDRVRKEFVGSNQSEMMCMVYTARYANNYPTFPKELLIHLAAFLVSLSIGFCVLGLKL
ncbi:unnamed protein product [Adineta ricciae]|uniref:Uncharacterized protein n=1 Tax=Adineta ricciae TaxID=249248 RepID=A0A813Q4X8_ADIRI|nr:unnamed protein product [Adineta ricciae]